MNICLNSELFGCRWRQEYIKLLCASAVYFRCAHQLTLVPYPYLRFNKENVQTKSTIKHLATAVCPSVLTAGIDIIKCVTDRKKCRHRGAVNFSTMTRGSGGKVHFFC